MHSKSVPDALPILGKLPINQYMPRVRKFIENCVNHRIGIFPTSLPLFLQSVKSLLESLGCKITSECPNWCWIKVVLVVNRGLWYIILY